MTIPTLIQNSNSRKFTTQFKKTISTLSQAAIMSQAQYDFDYSMVNTPSEDSTCASDSLGAGRTTLCAILNNTLAGKSYQGVYGTVPGIIPSSPYTIRTTSEGFDPTNFLIYNLADGVILGFNPNMSNCSLTPGNPLTQELLTGEGALANCVGFIDVNGSTGPNKEVTCKTETDTALSPNTTCAISGTMGDVFPIVFHNGVVEPASNAARAVLTSGKENGSSDSTANEDSDITTGEDSTANEEPQLTPEELEAQRIAKRRQFDKWEVKEITQGLSQSDCEAIQAQYDIQSCPNLDSYGGDKWAAAVQLCGGKDKIASEEDLSALAKTLYTNCNDNYYGEGIGRCTGFDSSKVPANLSGLGSSWYYLWSGTENGSNNAYNRNFNSSNSNRNNNNRNNDNPRVVCVGDKIRFYQIFYYRLPNFYKNLAAYYIKEK